MIFACAETPIDVIEREEVGAGGVAVSEPGSGRSGSGGASANGGTSGGRFPGGAPGWGGSDGPSGGAPPECDPAAVVEPGGIYRLQVVSSRRCLWRGEPTTVFGIPAYEPQLRDNCYAWPSEPWDGEKWQITDAALEGTFTVVSNAAQPPGKARWVFDVEARGFENTRLVLWADEDRDNQQFFLRRRPLARGDGSAVFELSPAHLPSNCVTEYADATRIQVCVPNDSRQEWFLIPDCR